VAGVDPHSGRWRNIFTHSIERAGLAEKVATHVLGCF